MQVKKNRRNNESSFNNCSFLVKKPLLAVNDLLAANILCYPLNKHVVISNVEQFLWSIRRPCCFSHKQLKQTLKRLRANISKRSTSIKSISIHHKIKLRQNSRLPLMVRSLRFLYKPIAQL